MAKKIAIYGRVEAKVPVFQRYWKRRIDDIKQRYWKKPKGRFKKVKMKDVRYEFYGSGKELYKAIKKALKIVPKGFITAAAEKFLKNPFRYGYEGVWVEREIETR